MDPEYITADVSDNHDVAILNTDDYEYFSWENMKLVAKPCNIYDGDTFSACWYYGDKVIKYRCRCLGYDSPEMRPRLNLEGRDEVKLNALKAKERFPELLEQDSTITSGRVVPVNKFKRGKKINFIIMKRKINEIIHPFRESSFQTINQDFLKNFFNLSFIYLKSFLGF